MHEEPSESGWTVRTLQRRDIYATAQLLADTFLENPTYVFMHPRASTRAWDLERFFVRNLSWRADLGLTWVVVDARDRVWGSATLEPPGGVPHSLGRMLRHWVLPSLKEQGARTVARIARTDAAFVRTYRELGGSEAYWHVHAVAIDESLRGRGLGTRLLRHLLARLDADPRAGAAPVLLSTQRERNVQLYARVGFELLRSQTFLGFRSWFMHRGSSGARNRALRRAGEEANKNPEPAEICTAFAPGAWPASDDASEEA
jgi:ribosomal protein S18 acetylase RimI-like enzyme